MSLEMPETMDECVYFTRRADGDLKIVAWTLKKECPKCHKGLMGKPVEKGHKKIRAPIYVCPECGYEESKKDHEETLTVSVKYTCPHCKHSGDTTTPFKRKTFQGVPSYVFVCDKCGEKIAITKKMKKPKKK